MSSPTPNRPPAAATRHFAGASIKTGAYQFIPLPFVDDWLIGRQRKGMVRSILEARGFTYDPAVPGLLAGGSRTFTARLRSMAKGAVLKPLRKAFRTVFFWMTAHRAARTVVETYFLGRFLHHAAVGAMDGGTHLSLGDGRRLAVAFEEVAKNIDLKAARNVVGRVRRLLTGGTPTDVTASELRGAIEKEDPGFVAEFDRLVNKKLGAM